MYPIAHSVERRASSAKDLGSNPSADHVGQPGVTVSVAQSVAPSPSSVSAVLLDRIIQYDSIGICPSRPSMVDSTHRARADFHGTTFLFRIFLLFKQEES